MKRIMMVLFGVLACGNGWGFDKDKHYHDDGLWTRSTITFHTSVNLVSFLLDETGSMVQIKEKTIKGFNKYVDKLEENKYIKFGLFRFNSENLPRTTNFRDIKYYHHLSDRDYQPEHYTPLFDAIANVIHATEQAERDFYARKVVIVILTDGIENRSDKWSHAEIMKLINQKEADGWKFIFLGVGLESWTWAKNVFKGTDMIRDHGFHIEPASINTSITPTAGEETLRLLNPNTIP